VQQLLVNMVDVNVRDSDGRNALIMASVNGHCEVVRQLLDSGANKNGGGRYNLDPMLEALFHGRRNVAQLLLDKGAFMDPRGRTLWRICYRMRLT
jgi:hypothetical protein